MLRHQTALASVLGSVLVVASLGDGEIRTLEDALGETARAIEVLHGIEKRLAQDPAGALGLVLSATEPPILDERARDERLEALRDEVNLLQMELDASGSPLAGAPLVPAPLSAATPAPMVVPLSSGGELTTGLDDSMRRLLELESAPTPVKEPTAGTRTAEARPAGPRAPAPSEPRTISPEGQGYSADPLHHAIACYRAERFAEVLELLGPDEKDLEALYWRARALEKLGRVDEALETLARVIERGKTGDVVERAATELEFLAWKRDFEARRAKSGEVQP